jgi:molybdate/tungstate transport system substrate-binding protein
MRHLLALILISSIALISCKNSSGRMGKNIIIFHAGSLSVPFKQLADEYEKKHPGIKILLEPAGSLVCARKITELKKPCDIIASADYKVISQLIIPDYASWSIRFATNEIVIAFQEKSKYASEIDSSNWMDILLKKDVIYARSDPDSDPCGYRSVFTFMLAGKYYNRPGLAEKLIAKDRNFIRPKEVDLVGLIESNAADYMFQYKSVAIQHNLKYIELPDEINLGNPAMNDLYGSVSLDVTGSSPGTKINVKGENINYSLTVLKNAENSNDAVDFVSFLLGTEGSAIFKRNGQEPLVPVITENADQIPESLFRYIRINKPE